MFAICLGSIGIFTLYTLMMMKMHNDRFNMQYSTRTAQQGAVQLSTVFDPTSVDAVQSRSPRLAQLAAYSAIANGTRTHTPTHPVNGGLPTQLQSGIESLSGIAMHDVRVHYNSSKPAQLQAHAYAQGSDIHLAPGQERHLPHEAWHVVQQKQGRVKPTLQLKGVAINDDSTLEREADVMGAQALQRHSIAQGMRPLHEPAGGEQAVQRMVIYTDNPNEIDEVIAADLAFQQALAGGQIITLADLLRAAPGSIRIDPDEVVVVAGHGSPGKVQGKTGAEIAQLLLKIRNIDKAAFIYIASCFAAADEPNRQQSSVIDITHQVLAQHGINQTVSGALGASINDFSRITGDTQVSVFEPTQDPAFAIESLVIHTQKRHGVKDSLGLNLDAAARIGMQLIQDPDFLKFYDTLINALGGIDDTVIRQLIAYCDEAIALVNSQDKWPPWLLGWKAHDEKQYQRKFGDAQWLNWKLKEINLAKKGLQDLQSGKVETYIAQAIRGDVVLKSRGQKGSKDTTRDRLVADAQWYREQRAVAVGMNQVGENESIKPRTDFSSEYIG
jgi:hypothetical protein